MYRRIVVVVILCFVKCLAEYPKKVCDTNEVCRCIKGWTGEPDCEQLDRRSPSPCAWVPQVRYFKYQDYSGPRIYLKQLKCRRRRQLNFDSLVIRGDTQWLDVGYSSIHNISSLRDNVLRYMPHLRALSLDRSEVQQLTGDLLSNNTNLEFVDMKWNQIATLPENLFSQNRKLIKVTLSGNSFLTIPRNIFKNNPELRELRIDYSHIAGLPSDLFEHNPKLRYLNCNYCSNLQFVSPRMFGPIPSIEFVGLLNTWFLHPNMRKEFCGKPWCVRNGYPPISNLQQLLAQYFH